MQILISFNNEKMHSVAWLVRIQKKKNWKSKSKFHLSYFDVASRYVSDNVQ
jgi:hypothetical protein